MTNKLRKHFLQKRHESLLSHTLILLGNLVATSTPSSKEDPKEVESLLKGCSSYVELSLSELQLGVYSCMVFYVGVGICSDPQLSESESL